MKGLFCCLRSDMLIRRVIRNSVSNQLRRILALSPTMSTTAMEEPSSEYQELPDQKPPQIRKAFNLLKTHASTVATFTLQWQDLEDHLQSIKNSIQSQLHLLRNPSPAVAGEDDPARGRNPSDAGEGEKLAQVLRARGKNRSDLCDLLAKSERPGELVLRAVAELRRPDPKSVNGSTVDYELNALRKNFVVLVEEFGKANPVIGRETRDEALRVAREWRKKITLEMDNSPEILGFMMVLDVFDLVSEFEEDDVQNLMANIVMRKQALELFRSLGLSDKASEFIKVLISIKKIVDAVRFIHAFELVKEFPPVPLLQNYVNDVKKATENSSKKDDAMKKEIAALRVVVKCIVDHHLNFSPKDLRDRIEFLKNQRLSKEKVPNPNPPKPEPSNNKRPNPQTLAPSPRNPQFGNKHPRTGPARANASVPPPREYHTAPILPERRAPEYSAMYRRPLGFLEGEDSRYSAEAAARYQPVSGQWAQYSPGPTSMGSGYGLSGSYVPEDQRMSSARYGAASSVSAERIRDLDERYGAGVASPLGASAYYPGDSLRAAGRAERPLPSGGGYETFSQRSSFHM